VRGRLGARLGFRGNLAPYVDAKVLPEISGDSRMTLGSGVDLDRVTAPGRGTWGSIESVVCLHSAKRAVADGHPKIG
jgi:hypothetical protein